jgi:rSAM/selenodomain-associated transferase 1
MMQRIVLFAKRPRLGRVKTRLCPPLSPQQALELYRAFLADQLRLLDRLRRDRMIELCLDGAWEAAELPQPLPQDLRITEQGPGDLGLRMLRALRRGREGGRSASVIVGADCPTLPVARVEHALRCLARKAQAVLVPAEDGGYVLIGMGEPSSALFHEIPWGTSEVLELTLRRAASNRIEPEILDSWYDVDDAEGLKRLQADVATPPGVARAPHTARVLAALARAAPGVV